MIGEPDDCWTTGSHCGIRWRVRFLLVSAFLGSCLPLHAATYWWASKRGSGNENWALANNWLNNTAPISNAGNNLVFDPAFLRDGGTTAPVDNSPNWIFNTLTLAQSSFSVEVQQSLTINTLTSANISPTTATANTINGNISVTGAGNLLFTAGNGTSTPSAAMNG